MTKQKSDEIIENCKLNTFEKNLLEALTTSKRRKEVYSQFECSEPTINREIAKLAKIIDNYENKKELGTKKLYIHIFPNGKKYVGVCQCCEDRWQNGHGYAKNKEMYQDIEKYGWDNIEHIILLENSNSEMIFQLEANLIKALKLYDLDNGYNKDYGLNR